MQDVFPSSRQAVNSVPRKMNFENNKRPSRLSDVLVLKAIYERWPLRTWFSPRERALYQFARLHNIASKSNGSLQIALSSRDLTVPRVGVLALLSVEGLSFLENRIEVIDELFEAGARILYATTLR